MARKGGPAAIELEGGPELRRAMKRFDDRLGDLTAVNLAAALTVEGQAEQLVPFVTGALFDSLRARATSRAGYVTAGGAAGVVYAGPIHFGWRRRNIEPQPFLYDALDERRGEILATYNAAVEDMVHRFDHEAPD